MSPTNLEENFLVNDRRVFCSMLSVFCRGREREREKKELVL